MSAPHWATTAARTQQLTLHNTRSTLISTLAWSGSIWTLMTHYWDSFVCGLKFDLACFWEVGGNPGDKPSNLSWESNQGPWSCEAAMLHHCGQQWLLFCASYGDSQTPRLTSLESSVRSNFFHCVVNSCCWGYINAPALRISWKASSIVRKAFAQFPLFDSRIQTSFRTTLHSLKVPSVNCVWVADTKKKKHSWERPPCLHEALLANLLNDCTSFCHCLYYKNTNTPYGESLSPSAFFIEQ